MRQGLLCSFTLGADEDVENKKNLIVHIRSAAHAEGLACDEVPCFPQLGLSGVYNAGDTT
jgi:hypothetical protein